MKITVIGGGSYSWGPTFARDVLVTSALRGSTLCLHDIDAERVGLVHRLAQKMVGDFSLDFDIQQTLSLDEALRGADAIILTITTGGLDAMRPDLEIPWKYGIRQSVGDTTGPGGLSRALRNIPVVARLAERVNALCPNALFLNYTNPMTTLTRTLAMFRTVPGRTVGLCHEYIGVREKLAQVFNVKPEEIQARVGGVNHFIWITALAAAGRDVWDELPRVAAAILNDAIQLDADDTSVFVDRARVKAALFQAYGVLPAAGDRHIAEFVPFILTEETDWGAQYGFRLTSVDDRAALMAFERGLIESALRGDTPLEPFMQELSGEAASQILAAVATNRPYTGIMNLPNTGQIDGLPRDAVVETFGTIDALGAQPLAFGAFPSAVQALLVRCVVNQEMTLAAALSGDRPLALQVLLNDPLLRGLSLARTEQMLNELLEANRTWLPQFAF